ncbi:hypothetical protein FOL47_006671 [Perkinsus chesapeaki]|uniref:Nucleoside phosphorylase domain-containing protein n=1 Tax=Perkinsus chesapeaki TaxID=330153 RepID=A0A7J6LR42_PERCH|nr:hypothetical protein FOL47_006671 [Perkinsus chesapeaki]
MSDEWEVSSGTSIISGASLRGRSLARIRDGRSSPASSSIRSSSLSSVSSIGSSVSSVNNKARRSEARQSKSALRRENRSLLIAQATGQGAERHKFLTALREEGKLAAAVERKEALMADKDDGVHLPHAEGSEMSVETPYGVVANILPLHVEETCFVIVLGNVILIDYVPIGVTSVNSSASFRYRFGSGSNFDDYCVFFVARHHSSGEGYSPPHEVPYRAIMWAMAHELLCDKIIALASVGSIRPDLFAVGDITMPTDFIDFAYQRGTMTFWGNSDVGPFSGDKGRIHYTPCEHEDQMWRKKVASTLFPFMEGPLAVRLREAPESELDIVYAQANGPRFESRSEIRMLQKHGHLVGMTCASEWTLAGELQEVFLILEEHVSVRLNDSLPGLAYKIKSSM